MTQLALFEVENSYQAQTSPTKLRGQYFTPPELAALMLDALPLALDTWVVDPSCGDGSFLRAAVGAVRRRFPAEPPARLAEWCAQRLIGFDIDPDAVQDARAGLREVCRERLGIAVPAERLRVFHADVLREGDLASLLGGQGLERPRSDEPLLVVGNPPYVEAKRLSRTLKQSLEARYPAALSGAPDLYLYFLHVCLGWLRSGDHLAFVLPNKLLVNANARAARERLLQRRQLRALWFATRAGLFGDAGVYPVVLFAAGRPTPAVEIRRLERDGEGSLAAGAPRRVEAASYAATQSRAWFLPPEEPRLAVLLEHLLTPAAGPRLSEVLEIRWAVSFHRTGLRERFVTPQQPESPHARRFVGGGAFSGNGEVTRYGIRWSGWWIDYDEDRLRRERNTLPPLELFTQPKIAICQNGRTVRAAFDDGAFVLKDTFLCGVPSAPDHPLCRHPRAVVGLLNSSLSHFFYQHVFYGGHVAGGFLHFLRGFLEDLPAGAWTEARAAAADRLVAQREQARREAVPALERQIDALAGEALGLKPSEQALIDAWAGEDPNWRAREQVRAARDLTAAPAPGRLRKRTV